VIRSQIIAVDAVAGTITLSGDQAKNPVKKVMSDAKIVIDTKAANLGDIKTGTLAVPLNKYRMARSAAQRKNAKDEATKILNGLLLFQTEGGLFALGKATKDQFISDLRGKVLSDDGSQLASPSCFDRLSLFSVTRRPSHVRNRGWTQRCSALLPRT
jgi:hypothetical protein